MKPEPRRETRTRSVPGGLLVCLTLLGLAACPVEQLPQSDDGGPRPVKVAVVRLAEVTDEVVSRAVVEPTRTVAVTPEASGVIREVTRGEGEQVRAGEPLVVIAPEDYRGGVEQASASAEAARAAAGQVRARFEASRTQYRRMKALRADRAVTEADLEQAEAAFRSAESALEAAEAQALTAEAGLRSARRHLGSTVVRAPFDGYVVEQRMHPGEVVRPMPPGVVLVLVDIDPVRVAGSVGELELPRVEEGVPAEVRLDAFPDRVFEAKVDRVNPLVDPTTRRARVRVVLPNPERRLVPGMVGELRLRLGSSEVLLAPRLALGGRQGDRARVWVVDDGRARPREVRLGERRGEDVVVREGLAAGETVVTWGHGALTDGAAVEVVAP